MRFTQDATSSVNIVRRYGEGEVRINDRAFRGSLIVSATALREKPDLKTVADLREELATDLLEFNPEVVLVGTGLKQVFPAASFAAAFLKSGIGFEAMDTGAACRTFNVLVGEQRRVVAVLLL